MYESQFATPGYGTVCVMAMWHQNIFHSLCVYECISVNCNKKKGRMEKNTEIYTESARRLALPSTIEWIQQSESSRMWNNSIVVLYYFTNSTFFIFTFTFYVSHSFLLLLLIAVATAISKNTVAVVSEKQIKKIKI